MPTPQPPSGLQAWGQQLWDLVVERESFDPAGYYLLGEACRTADIIERLSGALRSGSSVWLRLADEAKTMADGDTLQIDIVVNPLLGEIRQQRAAFSQLLARLKLGKSEVPTAEGVDPIAAFMAEFMPE